jgi:hypothetical protein
MRLLPEAVVLKRRVHQTLHRGKLLLSCPCTASSEGDTDFQAVATSHHATLTIPINEEPIEACKVTERVQRITSNNFVMVVDCSPILVIRTRIG